MKTPTEKEIQDEIAKLREMKPNVRKTSLFGDNHHDAIDKQIEILENPDAEGFCDESAIEENAQLEEWRDNEREAALEARRWLDGESEDGTPSKAKK